jgi:exodeoxyribonuclease VII large subunit
LFDAARKKPIPSLPRRIGIVTSPQAAALRDILNILQRRHHTANVLIFPSQVQGDAAASDVTAGIRYFNKAANVDVIIVARGGGSSEDLAAFNHEGLARAIASSLIPVISAVGHETDFTIIDFVADLRAATPSAAAELVIRSRQDIEEQSEELHLRLARAMRYRLLIGRQTLTELAQHGAFARMMDLINHRQQKLDDLTYRMEKSERRLLELHRRRWESAAAAVRHYDVRRVLAGIRRELDSHVAAMIAATRNQLLQQNAHLDRVTRQIEALSPLAILDRGYALVFDSAGKLLKDSTAVSSGDEISARLSRGSLTAIVKTTTSQHKA